MSRTKPNEADDGPLLDPSSSLDIKGEHEEGYEEDEEGPKEVTKSQSFKSFIDESTTQWFHIFMIMICSGAWINMTTHLCRRWQIVYPVGTTLVVALIMSVMSAGTRTLLTVKAQTLQEQQDDIQQHLDAIQNIRNNKETGCCTGFCAEMKWLFTMRSVRQAVAIMGPQFFGVFSGVYWYRTVNMVYEVYFKVGAHVEYSYWINLILAVMWLVALMFTAVFIMTESHHQMTLLTEKSVANEGLKVSLTLLGGTIVFPSAKAVEIVYACTIVPLFNDPYTGYWVAFTVLLLSNRMLSKGMEALFHCYKRKNEKKNKKGEEVKIEEEEEEGDEPAERKKTNKNAGAVLQSMYKSDGALATRVSVYFTYTGVISVTLFLMTIAKYYILTPYEYTPGEDFKRALIATCVFMAAMPTTAFMLYLTDKVMQPPAGCTRKEALRHEKSCFYTVLSFVAYFLTSLVMVSAISFAIFVRDMVMYFLLYFESVTDIPEWTMTLLCLGYAVAVTLLIPFIYMFCLSHGWFGGVGFSSSAFIMG